MIKDTNKPPRVPPLAKAHWLLGHARAMARAPHAFPAELANLHGGLARFRVGHKVFTAVTDADLARQILVERHERYERSFHYHTGQSVIGRGLLSTDGPEWLRRRRQALPAFQGMSLRQVAPATHAAMTEMLQRWEAERTAGRTVDAVREMQRLTLSVISRALLSEPVGPSDAERFGQAVRDSLRLVRQRNTAWAALPLWVPTAANRRLHQTRAILEDYLGPRLAARQRANGTHEDILGALRASVHPETGQAPSDRHLLDELKTLFVAGFETTATALAWALHLLARHPAVAARWYEEVDAVLNGRVPAWEDLRKLAWTAQVIHETLRLYPSVYSLGRVCVQDDDLGGMRIRPGAVVLISVYGIHRSARYWSDPEVFDPARFGPGRSRHEHAYLPFAVGKHTCIGKEFALAEMTVALAMLAQRYEIQPGHDGEVGSLAQITLVPDRPIPLRLIPRS